MAALLVQEQTPGTGKLIKELARMRKVLENMRESAQSQADRAAARGDREKAKDCRKIVRAMQKQIEETDSFLSALDEENRIRSMQREKVKRIDYEQYRVDDTVPYTLSDTALTSKKPSAFSFLGRRYEASSWKQLLVEFCRILNRTNPMLFASVEFDENFRGRNKQYFTRDPSVVISAAKIPDSDLYVETHVSARMIRKIILKLLNLYKLSEDDFIVYFSKDFTPLRADKAQQKAKTENEKRKEGEEAQTQMPDLQSDKLVGVQMSLDAFLEED